MSGKRLRHILILFCVLIVSTASAGERWRFIVVGDSQGMLMGVNRPKGSSSQIWRRFSDSRAHT